MYSKEEKERILADFFESGMTEKAFSDLPCRPSRMSMRRWRAAAERGELEVPERRVAGRVDHERYARYPAATKAEAVRAEPRGDAERRRRPAARDQLALGRRGMGAPSRRTR